MAELLSVEHKYIPRTEQRENNLFLEEYYSSTDTRIYFDDIEQTEIGYIGYSLQEQLKPLYGYSSYTYDDMAVGNRIVTGTFKVPIKNPTRNNSLTEVKAILGNGYSEHEDYNRDQELLLLSTDWVDNTKGSSASPVHEATYHYSSSDYGYVDKLNQLGYDVDTNSSDETIRNAIRQFQARNDIVDGDGALTSETRKKINEEFENSHETINLTVGMKLYDGPSEIDYNVIGAIKKNEKATVQYKYTDGWMQVISESGVKGFIRV